MKHAPLFVSLFAFLLLFSFAETRAETAAYRFQKGDRYTFQAEYQEKVKFLKERMEKKIAYTLDVEVKDVEEGEAVLLVKFTRISVKESGAGKKTSWDSAKRRKDEKPTDVPYLYSVLIGQTVTVLMDKTGCVNEVEGYDRFKDIYVQEYKAANPFAAKLMGDRLYSLGRMKFNNLAWKRRMAKFFVAFPGKTLAAKDEFPEDLDTLSYKYHCLHKLSSISSSSVKTKISGKVSTAMKGTTFKSNKISGSCEFDLKKGMLKKKSMTVSFKAKSDLGTTEVKESLKMSLKSHKAVRK